MKEISVKIEYYPELKGKKTCFRVMTKQKMSISNIFNPDAYFWHDVGSFETLQEAEEFALSRADKVDYKRNNTVK